MGCKFLPDSLGIHVIEVFPHVEIYPGIVTGMVDGTGLTVTMN